MLTGSPLPVGAGLGPSCSDTFSRRRGHRPAVRRAGPGTSTVGVDPLLIVGGLACLLLVDLCACTLRRVPLAGLPLLTIYSIPVSMLDGGVSVVGLRRSPPAASCSCSSSRSATSWSAGAARSAATRPSDPAGFSVRTGAVRATAGTIGGVATALAVFLPLFVPTLGLALLRRAAAATAATTSGSRTR